MQSKLSKQNLATRFSSEFENSLERKQRIFGDFSSKIKKKTFVCCYVSEIITNQEYQQRQQFQYNNSKTNFVLVLRENFRQKTFRTNFDATSMSNFARFFNHSCDPNLELVVLRKENIIPKIGFLASRDIEINEELCFSYGGLQQNKTENQKQEDKQKLKFNKCFCMSKNCIGYLPFDETI